MEILIVVASLIGIGVFIGWFFFSSSCSEQKKIKDLQYEMINKQMLTLVEKYKNAQYRDDYANLVSDKANTVLDNFLLNTFGLDKSSTLTQELKNHILQELKNHGVSIE